MVAFAARRRSSNHVHRDACLIGPLLRPCPRPQVLSGTSRLARRPPDLHYVYYLVLIRFLQEVLYMNLFHVVNNVYLLRKYVVYIYILILILYVYFGSTALYVVLHLETN